eukprot:scaffold203234_cov12-Prasinocladus_malaysianus.AAC.1
MDAHANRIDLQRIIIAFYNATSRGFNPGRGNHKVGGSLRRRAAQCARTPTSGSLALASANNILLQAGYVKHALRATLAFSGSELSDHGVIWPNSQSHPKA